MSIYNGLSASTTYSRSCFSAVCHVVKILLVLTQPEGYHVQNKGKIVLMMATKAYGEIQQ